MNWRNLLPRFGSGAKNLALETAIGAAITGKVNVKNLDDEALAIAIFSLADQIHARHPGLAEKYGWARIEEVQLFTRTLLGASQATKPDGLN